jgi:glycosyltransferase involved in cell wall biosynthesis
MNIAIDTTPLNDTRILSHRVRGSGFYIENLKKSLSKHFPKNKYKFFTKGDTVASDTDIIHYPYFEPFFLTLPILEEHKRIVTVHDLTPLVFPRHFPSGLKGKIKWQIQKQGLIGSDRIITDSESSKKDIVKHAGIAEEKIDVVYLAADEAFKRIKNQESRIKEIHKKYNLPQKFVLYVGDATWNKNLPRLIEASIKAKVPLVMAGKSLTETNFDKANPWNKDLALTQEMIIDNDHVEALGFVPLSDLVALYNTATCFVMPSLYEGFGLPILEAMASGCPVIASTEGSLPEVAGNAAYFVDAYDTESIANGINEVFNNKKLQKILSDKGLKQAKEFSWKKTASDTIKAYEKALSA